VGIWIPIPHPRPPLKGGRFCLRGLDFYNFNFRVMILNDAHRQAAILPGGRFLPLPAGCSGQRIGKAAGWSAQAAARAVAFIQADISRQDLRHDQIDHHVGLVTWKGLAGCPGRAAAGWRRAALGGNLRRSPGSAEVAGMRQQGIAEAMTSGQPRSGRRAAQERKAQDVTWPANRTCCRTRPRQTRLSGRPL
jgi:hypothetical protein